MDEGFVVPRQCQLMMLRSKLIGANVRSSQNCLKVETYRMISKFRHNGVHCVLILLQQLAKLLIFVKQGLIFNDNVSIHPLQLRLERL